MAGAAGLEPVTSAVTGQRSNQLSYAPASKCIMQTEECGLLTANGTFRHLPLHSGNGNVRNGPSAVKLFSENTENKTGSMQTMFGQQTPRRWGWGTPLKKRTATRTRKD